MDGRLVEYTSGMSGTRISGTFDGVKIIVFIKPMRRASHPAVNAETPARRLANTKIVPIIAGSSWYLRWNQ